MFQLTIQLKKDIFMAFMISFLKLTIYFINIHVNPCILIFMPIVLPYHLHYLKLCLNSESSIHHSIIKSTNGKLILAILIDQL